MVFKTVVLGSIQAYENFKSNCCYFIILAGGFCRVQSWNIFWKTPIAGAKCVSLLLKKLCQRADNHYYGNRFSHIRECSPRDSLRRTNDTRSERAYRRKYNLHEEMPFLCRADSGRGNQVPVLRRVSRRNRPGDFKASTEKVVFRHRNHCPCIAVPRADGPSARLD